MLKGPSKSISLFIVSGFREAKRTVGTNLCLLLDRPIVSSSSSIGYLPKAYILLVLFFFNTSLGFGQLYSISWPRAMRCQSDKIERCFQIGTSIPSAALDSVGCCCSMLTGGGSSRGRRRILQQWIRCSFGDDRIFRKHFIREKLIRWSGNASFFHLLSFAHDAGKSYFQPNEDVNQCQ